jgi:hypothetical protein
MTTNGNEEKVIDLAALCGLGPEDVEKLNADMQTNNLLERAEQVQYLKKQALA